jgi:uncharacterized CHY-type Zn-finger protein
MATASSKIGRNDPCPCRSGRKYKACCQARQELLALRVRRWSTGRRAADCLVCGAVLPLGQLRIFPDVQVRHTRFNAAEPARACEACVREAEKEESDAA